MAEDCKHDLLTQQWNEHGHAAIECADCGADLGCLDCPYPLRFERR